MEHSLKIGSNVYSVGTQEIEDALKEIESKGFTVHQLFHWPITSILDKGETILIVLSS